MERSDKVKREAKELEARLIAEGRHLDAQIVQRLRRSAASAVGTLKIVHADNTQLRQQLGLPSFADERGAK